MKSVCNYVEIFPTQLFKIKVVQLTVPAVSNISNIHCCPSTSTCWGKIKWNRHKRFERMLEWTQSGAGRTETRSNFDLLFDMNLRSLGHISRRKFLAQTGQSGKENKQNIKFIKRWNRSEFCSLKYCRAPLFPTVGNQYTPTSFSFQQLSKWKELNCDIITKALLPTPPEPRTTSLYSRMLDRKVQFGTYNVNIDNTPPSR